MAIKPWIAFLIMVFIVYIPLFAHLDSSPLAEWDESHLATNALEMNSNHNWIVTSINNSPEMWQTKPPLMIWLQVIMMKVLGINELAVRLPSAIAALGTCLLLFFFFIKKYKEPFLGLIIISVLISTDGYIELHGVRYGEYDSLLTMLMTGYALSYFLYLEENKKKYIYATFIMITLAALTKGIQSLLFLPAMVFYAVYKKKTMEVLKQKELYIGIAGFLFFVIGYYLLREHYNPGYLAAVWQNELGGRYNTVIEGHSGDAFIYYDWLADHFRYWYLWVLPGAVYGMCSTRKWLKDITVFVTLLLAVYFIILCNAQTKIPWYMIPAYPLFSILVATGIYAIFSILVDAGISRKEVKYKVLPFVFIAVIFFEPYSKILNIALARPHGNALSDEANNMELFLQDVLHKRRNINGFSIADPGGPQSLDWYYRVFMDQKRPIGFINEKDLVPNSMIIAYKPETKKFIRDHFNTQVIQTYYTDVIQYKINDRK